MRNIGQERASADELGAVRRRFAALARRWEIGIAEAGALAACDEHVMSGFLDGDRALSVRSETRVRLLIDLAGALERLLPLSTCPAEWLREAMAECEGERPIDIFRGPTAGLRAVRDGLIAMLGGGV